MEGCAELFLSLGSLGVTVYCIIPPCVWRMGDTRDPSSFSCMRKNSSLYTQQTHNRTISHVTLLGKKKKKGTLYFVHTTCMYTSS